MGAFFLLKNNRTGTSSGYLLSKKSKPLLIRPMSKKDYLSATTIAQCSYCENQLVLEKKYGSQKTDLGERRQHQGDEEHLRHHLAAVKHGTSKDGRCFIASEVYGPLAPETEILRNFRDTSLSRNIFGRVFIAIYYDVSPVIVSIIKNMHLLRAPMKLILDALVRSVK